jgi:hypothetical protein
MFLGFFFKDYLQYSNELARVPVILCKLQISERFAKLIDIKKKWRICCDGGTVDGLVEAISAPSGIAAENTAAASSVRTAAASLGPACRRARSRRRSFHLFFRLCFREFAALLRTLVKVKNDC